VKTTYRSCRVSLALSGPILVVLSVLALGLFTLDSGPAALAAQAGKTPARSSQSAGKPSVPPAEPGLSIAITDGRAKARRGDKLSYVVMVKNAGGATARNLWVWLNLPPYLKLTSASRPATAKGGKVTWHASLRAGRTVSFTMKAVVGRTPAGLAHLAVVACAAERNEAPVIYAAHLDQLPRAAARPASARTGRAVGPAGSRSPVRYVAAALALLVCAVVAAFTAKRIRTHKYLGTHS
jgi:uncharacterized repeat protein (TIGR01451 family)